MEPATTLITGDHSFTETSPNKKILIVKIENPLIRYDMVTDIPNAYFVEVGIYKWNGSPTYTLGR